jgi:hypothetical protein
MRIAKYVDFDRRVVAVAFCISESSGPVDPAREFIRYAGKQIYLNDDRPVSTGLDI